MSDTIWGGARRSAHDFLDVARQSYVSLDLV